MSVFFSPDCFYKDTRQTEEPTSAVYIVQFKQHEVILRALLIIFLQSFLQAALEFLSSLSQRADEAAQKFHIEGYNVSKRVDTRQGAEVHA